MDRLLPAPPAAVDAALDADAVRRAVEALEALAADPAKLADLSEDDRVRLMQLAGRLARPTPLDRSKLRKAMRKRKKADQRAEDKKTKDASAIREARAAAVYQAPDQVQHRLPAPARHLKKARYCYVCKAPYTKLHFFYDTMCEPCADFNYQKRFQTADMRGQTALITGARLKIGYQASLMMLRAGARVIATTRFPQDAAVRYSREKDFGMWKENLSVHGLDLRHSPSVEIFARYLEQTEKRLDVLINNAAQTVRRPVAFYQHLLPVEALPVAELPKGAADVLRSHEACKTALLSAHEKPAGVDTTGLAVWHAGAPGVGIRESAKLSQLRYTYDDAQAGREVFPDGRIDADLQQVDLRVHNSWRMTLHEVSTPELLEVQLVNAVAPFVLCGKLKPLMLRHKTGAQHVVNVSAMEGSFSRRTKTDKHPHTNMAKAALNMMTLTSAPDYKSDGIHMNAVDTGWVTDEDPAQHSTRKKEELDFQPPLDIVDGAARVCDPFLHGLNTGDHVWGKFLKDYKPTPW